MNNQTEKIKKTVIIVGYACNNNCRFCIDSNKRQLINKSAEQIKQEMIGARERGTTYLEFIGGELTIRSDFEFLLKFAKFLGFETIMMATNGRMLSYFDYAKKLTDAGLNSVVFSIHGYNSQEHDFLTQAEGSFKQLMSGLDNMKKLLGEKKIGTNTTIVKKNYKNIEKIGKLIYNKGIRNSEFIFVDCNEGGAYDNFYEFVPKISAMAPYVHKCLELGKINLIPHWHIRYVPLCYFTDFLNQISELMEVKNFQTEHLAPDFTNFDVEGSRRQIARIQTEKCRECVLSGQCEGIWKTYYQYYGDEELIPVLK